MIIVSHLLRGTKIYTGLFFLSKLRPMREVASQSLHCLTAKAPEYMVSTILPLLLKGCTSIDLVERHGAILAAAEVTHALSKRATPDR